MAQPPAQRRHQASDTSLADDQVEAICPQLACSKSWRSKWRHRDDAPNAPGAQERPQTPKSPPTQPPEHVARAGVSLPLPLLHNGTGGGATALMPARAQHGSEPVPSRRTLDRLGRRHHPAVTYRGARSSMADDRYAQDGPYGPRCPRVTCAAPPPSLNLTGERGTFLRPWTRTVRGHREVSRAQQTACGVSALVMNMVRAPQYVCGAATVGHLQRTSRQHTLPMANHAGIHQAEKTQKTAHRIFLSLDNRGPHKCSACLEQRCWASAADSSVLGPLAEALRQQAPGYLCACQQRG